MGTGFYHDGVCRCCNGTKVFHADMGSGTAAHADLQFCTAAEAGGEFSFDRVGDAGQHGAGPAPITVTA